LNGVYTPFRLIPLNAEHFAGIAPYSRFLHDV